MVQEWHGTGVSEQAQGIGMTGLPLSRQHTACDMVVWLGGFCARFYPYLPLPTPTYPYLTLTLPLSSVCGVHDDDHSSDVHVPMSRNPNPDPLPMSIRVNDVHRGWSWRAPSSLPQPVIPRGAHIEAHSPCC